MYKNFSSISKYKRAFTLAEVLITLVVIGVIAAITVPIIIAEHVEQQTVAKVKKMYSTVAQVVMQYQIENGCTQDIAYCFEDGEHHTNKKFYEKFEKHLNIVQKIYPQESLANVDWLPTTGKRMNGTAFGSYTWYGVFKPGNKNSQCVYYMLGDGSVITFIIPDSLKHSGFAFFDTNGKKPPNQVGKDQFPIGIGAYNNPKYADRVHAFYNEDDQHVDHGLCNITNNHECNADECTQTNCSPTAYVLKNNKLPRITW